MSHPAEPDSTLDTLAAALRGALIRPHDAGWDAARAPWNLSVDQRPVAVAVPRDIDDVRHVLSAARAGGYGVTVQPRGHGPNTDLADCILVRMDAFLEVAVDTAARVARVGAGVKWGSLLPRLDGTGLIALAGTSGDVTIAGYLLSGGHSWFSRRHGLAAHSIRAVELVDAQGTLRRVTAASDPELLWAVRGGGGLFGVVTALEIDLFAAPGLFGGKILFPDDAAEFVFEQVAAIMEDAPDELSIFPGLINMPDVDMVPEAMRGRRFATADVVFIGTAEEGAELLAPLRHGARAVLDQTGPFPIGRLGEVAAEPDEPLGVLEWAAAVTELDDDELDALAEAFRTASPAGMSMLQIRPLGGALSDPTADDHGAVGHLDARYLIFAGVFLMGPEAMGPGTMTPESRADAFAPFREAVEGLTVPRIVPTFLARGQDLTDAYSPATLARLAEIKRAVDPDNIIRSNRPLGAKHDPAPGRTRPAVRSADDT